jgi:hypothetical protein
VIAYRVSSQIQFVSHVFPPSVEKACLEGSYSGFLALAKDTNNKGEITGRGADPITGVLMAYLAVPVSQ